eukprot:479393-Pyramimonas_sp.AAC.1
MKDSFQRIRHDKTRTKDSESGIPTKVPFLGRISLLRMPYIGASSSEAWTQERKDEERERQGEGEL